jgi:hypothetical protein
MVLKVFTKRLVSGAAGENSVENPVIIFKSTTRGSLSPEPRKPLGNLRGAAKTSLNDAAPVSTRSF